MFRSERLDFTRPALRSAAEGRRLVRLCAARATLNFGQGGLLLTDPGAVESPFYQLAPQWSHYGLVVLATLATVIASQAIITGAYSLTQQAIQLGFLPRMNVIHTAGHERGQIYIPFMNWMLAIATLAAVIGFASSDAAEPTASRCRC